MSGLAFHLILSACSPTAPVATSIPREASLGTVTVTVPAIATSTIRPSTPTITPTLVVPSIILSGHTDRVTQLAWNPDGTLLASAANPWQENDYTIRLWNSAGQLIHT